MTKVKNAPVFYIFCMLVTYLFFFLLKAPTLANESILNALNICYTRVIPSLFPFMVLSEIIVSSNIAEDIGNIFGKTVSKILWIKKIASTAFILGCLFGFPLGTKTTVSLYEKGCVTKEETERLICFCSNTGPAFVLGLVGSVLNKQIAFCIYLSQVISAFLIGLALRKNKADIDIKQENTDRSFSILCVPQAITSAVFPILNICAFVCFFSCISASVENILTKLSLPDSVQIFVNGTLEIINGISELQDCPINAQSIFFAAFFVGWSGISVILQSINITSKHSLSCKKFVILKLIQGVLCAFLTLFVCKILKIC